MATFTVVTFGGYQSFNNDDMNHLPWGGTIPMLGPGANVTMAPGPGVVNVTNVYEQASVTNG